MDTMETFPFRFTVIKAGGGVLQNFTTSILSVLIDRVNELTPVGHIPMLTVSAFKGVTNKLDGVYILAMAGQIDEAKMMLEEIFTAHTAIVNNLDIKHEFKMGYARDADVLRREATAVMKLMDPEMRKLGKDPTDSSRKMKAEILSFGERLSVCVLKNALASRGFGVYALQASRFMLGSTDVGKRKYTDAVVSFPQMKESLRDLMEAYTGSIGFLSKEKQSGKILPLALTAGFIGVDENNDTVNLGREGSDTSAVAIAHALGQKEAYFLKDVEPDKPITANRWADVQDMEIATGSHLIGRTAISSAIEFGMHGVIVNFETGDQYRITC